jgi:predicted dehydrogenase
MSGKLRFAAVGLDHRHIYHLVGENITAGAACVGYCPQTSDPRVLEGFRERFPTLRSMDRERLIDDPSIDFIVSAAIPRDRPTIAIKAMRAGKDVMVDKPGAVTSEQVAQIERVAGETGRIFSICFSERFVVRACEAAARLVAAGEIGRVVQTTGLGPHRLNRAIRVSGPGLPYSLTTRLCGFVVRSSDVWE